MKIFSTIIDDLAEHGWSVTPNLVSGQLIEDLLNEQNQLFESGKFKKAGIGRESGKVINSEIRGDEIIWFDDENLLPAQKEYSDLMTVFRHQINLEFYLGLTEFECHFAKYPVGSFYKRHLDQFKNSGSRLISCILYLNKNWANDDEGFLRLYLENETLDVFPEAGTFVCFKSEEIEHEVFPTKRERNSVTGWMRK